MGNKTALLVMAAAVAGFVIWFNRRPVESGTKINAVAGLRG